MDIELVFEAVTDSFDVDLAILEPNQVDIDKAARVSIALERLVQREQADGLAIGSCMGWLPKGFPCLGFARLRDRGWCSVFVAMAAVVTQASDTITLKSLLDEMIDREAAARFPRPAFTCRQASSYDRASVSAQLP